MANSRFLFLFLSFILTVTMSFPFRENTWKRKYRKKSPEYTIRKLDLFFFMCSLLGSVKPV